MRDQALTRREEARLIKAYQRVLLGGGFPNPDRAGCPGNETLRAMAFRKLETERVNGWRRWPSSHPPVITAHHHVVADLRNRMILRGDQGTGPGKGPLVFERGFDEATIYLPEGSRAGPYEVAIFREELGEPLTRATGAATMANGMTAMNTMLDLSRVAPGHYLLGVRLSGADWSYSPLVIE